MEWLQVASGNLNPCSPVLPSCPAHTRAAGRGAPVLGMQILPELKFRERKERKTENFLPSHPLLVLLSLSLFLFFQCLPPFFSFSACLSLSLSPLFCLYLSVFLSLLLSVSVPSSLPLFLHFSLLPHPGAGDGGGGCTRALSLPAMGT